MGDAEQRADVEGLDLGKRDTSSCGKERAVKIRQDEVKFEGGGEWNTGQGLR